jgi:hypothetical protein
MNTTHCGDGAIAGARERLGDATHPMRGDGDGD